MLAGLVIMVPRLGPSLTTRPSMTVGIRTSPSSVPIEIERTVEIDPS
jgi:hypothetical protein